MANELANSLGIDRLELAGHFQTILHSVVEATKASSANIDQLASDLALKMSDMVVATCATAVDHSRLRIAAAAMVQSEIQSIVDLVAADSNAAPMQ